MLKWKIKKINNLLKNWRRLWKFFVFLFLINLIIINWNDLSWIFNYRAVYGGVNSLLERNKTEELRATGETEIKEFSYVDKENSIEIPKIGIIAPIVFSQSDSEEDFEKALKKGVLYYPQSVLPGEEGRTIILGHSAPPNWPKINYDWVFSQLSELNTGDEIYIYFNNRQYPYQVTRKFSLNPGEEIPSEGLTNSKSILILLTCWPPGKDLKRMAVEAELAISKF